MGEIKISTLLTKLKELARNVGEKENPPFTAERFLIALIDAFDKEWSGEEQKELEKAGNLFKHRAKIPRKVREVMLEYVTRANAMEVMDDLYMQKALQRAEGYAKSIECDTISVFMLLGEIFKEPSTPIKSILKRAHSIGEQLPEVDSFDYDADDDEFDTDDSLDTASESDDVKDGMSELVSSVKRIRGNLQKVVYGQENAINVFASGYFRSRLLSMIDKKKTRPGATFLFAGPPGVGKTFLAEQIAGQLGLPFMRFDMSEYGDKEAAIEFCGSDNVYRNSKGGNLTTFVKENPKCVLLFDEIEKAHISIIHLFLQVLDAGRLRDSNSDDEISFADAIIIMTTNAGRQLYEDSESGDFSAVPRKVIIKALQKDINPITNAPYFPAAICSRFASGNVVMFNHIGANNLRRIAKTEIERQAANLKREIGIELCVQEEVYTALLFSEGSNADARTIRGRAEAFFNDELYELLRLISAEGTSTSIDSIERIGVKMDFEGVDATVRSLFVSNEKIQVLILAGESTVELCRERLEALEVYGVQNASEAAEIMKEREIDLVLLDIKYNAQGTSLANLNAEDAQSPARDLLKILKEQGSEVPVYLLEENGEALSEEERVSFVRKGIRGIIPLAKDDGSFSRELVGIAEIIYQQRSMIRLARENKLVSFETAQSVSADGKYAEIKLFDLKLAVAVDSEDSKNVLSAVSKPNVHFDEVIGAEDAKKELTYFVEYLRNPKKYMGTGVKAPKGVILYGPPGTGKTMLAKAMACEAGVTFVVAEGNQFLKKYVGEGSEKVHELFKTARKYAPSVLFIDEIDAIAKERRGNDDTASNGEETLTAFLTEMDGFVSDPSKPVFVLAATNFDVTPGSSKSLDPALMRRFDRRIYIDLPAKADRIRFLRGKIAKNAALCISPEQLENIATRATGMSLAALDSIVELALRSAIRENSTTVTDAILEEAFETFNSGEEKKWDASQLERTARHEAGHALLCKLGGETPTYVTVVARGNHGGYMQRAEQEGKAIYTVDELLTRIRTSLGGRAAELVYYGERDGMSTGASGDLENATAIARQIVCSFGMDSDFGLAVMDRSEIVGTMSAEVRAAVNRILAEQMREAVRLISENRSVIDELVRVLIDKNYIGKKEIETLLGNI